MAAMVTRMIRQKRTKAEAIQIRRATKVKVKTNKAELQKLENLTTRKKTNLTMAVRDQRTRAKVQNHKTKGKTAAKIKATLAIPKVENRQKMEAPMITARTKTNAVTTEANRRREHRRHQEILNHNPMTLEKPVAERVPKVNVMTTPPINNQVAIRSRVTEQILKAPLTIDNRETGAASGTARRMARATVTIR